ncbi:MAG: ATP-dependent Clp protease proteolytic subunit [Pseudomonadota bacterium]
MTTNQKNQLTLFTTLFLFGVIAFLMWSGDQALLRGAPELDVDARGDGTVVFSWRGDVRAPMARRFEDAFEEWRGEADAFLIRLDSPGGALAEGNEVIGVIRYMQRSHPVMTEILPGDDCLSMCVPIFMQGEQRRAAPNARFMFHQPIAVDLYTDEVAEQLPAEREYVAERFLRRYFDDGQVDPAWVDRLRDDWQRGDVWKSGRDLVDEGSGIVTELG